jgi:translation initiation factor IF-1
MPRAERFEVEGVITEVLPNGTYRVELANGHRLLAFVTGRARQSFVGRPGISVKLDLSPFDLSEGRIIVKAEKI